MTAKSAVKFLASAEAGGFFRWVAILTRSKNAIKGLGFFVGAALLSIFGFHAVLDSLAVFLCIVLDILMIAMPNALPQGEKSVKSDHAFSKYPNINRLAFARVFFFVARDAWFVIAIPICFYAFLSDGSVRGNRAAFFVIGAFIALWTIFLGVVQSNAPTILKASAVSLMALLRTAWQRVAALVVLSFILGLVAYVKQASNLMLTTKLVVGLFVFGSKCAENSALYYY